MLGFKSDYAEYLEFNTSLNAYLSGLGNEALWLKRCSVALVATLAARHVLCPINDNDTDETLLRLASVMDANSGGSRQEQRPNSFSSALVRSGGGDNNDPEVSVYDLSRKIMGYILSKTDGQLRKLLEGISEPLDAISAIKKAFKLRRRREVKELFSETVDHVSNLRIKRNKRALAIFVQHNLKKFRQLDVSLLDGCNALLGVDDIEDFEWLDENDSIDSFQSMFVPEFEEEVDESVSAEPMDVSMEIVHENQGLPEHHIGSISNFSEETSHRAPEASRTASVFEFPTPTFSFATPAHFPAQSSTSASSQPPTAPPVTVPPTSANSSVPAPMPASQPPRPPPSNPPAETVPSPAPSAPVTPASVTPVTSSRSSPAVSAAPQPASTIDPRPRPKTGPASGVTSAVSTAPVVAPVVTTAAASTTAPVAATAPAASAVAAASSTPAMTNGTSNTTSSAPPARAPVPAIVPSARAPAPAAVPPAPAPAAPAVPTAPPRSNLSISSSRGGSLSSTPPVQDWVARQAQALRASQNRQKLELPTAGGGENQPANERTIPQDLIDRANALRETIRAGRTQNSATPPATARPALYLPPAISNTTNPPGTKELVATVRQNKLRQKELGILIGKTPENTAKQNYRREYKDLDTAIRDAETYLRKVCNVGPYASRGKQRANTSAPAQPTTRPLTPSSQGTTTATSRPSPAVSAAPPPATNGHTADPRLAAPHPASHTNGSAAASTDPRPAAAAAPTHPTGLSIASQPRLDAEVPHIEASTEYSIAGSRNSTEAPSSLVRSRDGSVDDGRSPKRHQVHHVAQSQQLHHPQPHAATPQGSNDLIDRSRNDEIRGQHEDDLVWGQRAPASPSHPLSHPLSQSPSRHSTQSPGAGAVAHRFQPRPNPERPVHDYPPHEQDGREEDLLNYRPNGEDRGRELAMRLS